MPYSLVGGAEYAKCPCCSEKAFSLDEIEDVFGFRVMETGKEIPQSYCRACRIARCKVGEACKRIE